MGQRNHEAFGPETDETSTAGTDDLLDTLANADRRFVLAHLSRRETEPSLGSLATALAADSDDFFGAVVEAYDREAALSMVEEHFVFSTPLREERDAFAFELAIDPGDVLGGLARALPTLEVDFTDEALRSMGRAEQLVIPQAKTDIEQAYES